MKRSRVTYADKLLPNQPELTDLCHGSALTEAAILDTILWITGSRRPYEDFDLRLSDRFTPEEMGSPPVTYRLLEFLIVASGARTVLEIGTFIGVSALYLARSLPPGGKVVTFERFDQFAAIARENFSRNRMEDRIQLIEGDAMESLKSLPKSEKFDLMFIDGNKERYDEYFAELEPRLNRPGIVVIDDCLFNGDALSTTPSSEKGRGVRRVLEVISKRDDLLRLVLPVANGILIVRKP
jgi:caffeoyl-CoA O-methyltransferase